MWNASELLLVQALVYLGITGGLLAAVYLWADRDERLRRRLSELKLQEREHAAKLGRLRGMMRLLSPLVPHLSEVLLPNDEHTRTRLQAKLIHAGIYSPGALSAYFSLKLMLMAGPPFAAISVGSLGWTPFWPTLFVGGVLGLGGIVLPSLWLARRQRKRQAILRRSLPDFFDLIIACLEGGLSFQASLKQVADELKTAHPVVAGELQLVTGEMEIGQSLEQALDHLAERTQLDELRTLCTFVSQAQKFGTTMADAVQQLAIVLRTQREHRAEEMAQQAAVKILIPTLLFIFPTIFVVLAGPAAIRIRESLARAGPHSASAEKKGS